jgi:hypothetical protein
VSGRIEKVQPKVLCDNEWYALGILGPLGWAPWPSVRKGLEEIVMPCYSNSDIIFEQSFRRKCYDFLDALESCGLRHGDLQPPNIFVITDNLVSWPLVIDWSESRDWCDRRENKRPGPDEFWLIDSMNPENAVDKIVKKYKESGGWRQ